MSHCDRYFAILAFARRASPLLHPALHERMHAVGGYQINKVSLIGFLSLSYHSRPDNSIIFYGVLRINFWLFFPAVLNTG